MRPLAAGHCVCKLKCNYSPAIAQGNSRGIQIVLVLQDESIMKSVLVYAIWKE